MIELFLIRHAQTDWNAEGRMQGRTDRPLSAAGRSQAFELRSALGNTPFDIILCSGLARTRETGTLAGLKSIRSNPLWQEVDLGRWSGQLIDDVRRTEPETYRAWRQGLADPPGGEGWDAFDNRIRAALCGLATTNFRRVAVLTHSGVIRAAVRILTGANHIPLQTYENASVTPVIIDQAKIKPLDR